MCSFPESLVRIYLFDIYAPDIVWWVQKITSITTFYLFSFSVTINILVLHHNSKPTVRKLPPICRRSYSWEIVQKDWVCSADINHNRDSESEITSNHKNVEIDAKNVQANTGEIQTHNVHTTGYKDYLFNIHQSLRDRLRLNVTYPPVASKRGLPVTDNSNQSKDFHKTRRHPCVRQVHLSF